MTQTTSNTLENPIPKKQGNRSLLYIVLIILLVGINIYLYVKYYQKDALTQVQAEQIDQDSTRIADLDTKYTEALVQIESYKGQNSTLDSILVEKEKELLNYKVTLDNLKKQKKISEDQFNKQVDQLNNMLADLTNQIEQLQKEKNILITKNDSLGQSLAQQMTTNTQLTNVNKDLSLKVNIASLLKPTTITGTGVRGKSSGKEVETTNAKKTEQLRVCFNVPDNKVADPGDKTFYVRIISPEGVTIAVQSSGSGVIKIAETNEERMYTTTKTIDYDQSAQDVCAYWKQSAPYPEGEYTAEIYQDGYQLGSTKFELK